MTTTSAALARPEESRFLSKEESEALLARLIKLARGGGLILPTITSWWSGEVRWGRNRVNLAGDRRDIRISVQRTINGSVGWATTNQTDDASLEGVVRAAERSAARWGRFEQVNHESSFDLPSPPLPMPRPTIWSDATYNLTAEARGELARTLTAKAEAQGLLSAGYIEVRAGSLLRIIHGTPRYDRYTQAQCSMTVRDLQGTGSGWAGLSSYDWAKIDGPALAERALVKCLDSRNPVALEPGRYTVVLEPQAVADLLESSLVGAGHIFDRQAAENGSPPFGLRGFHFDVKSGQQGKSMLGLKVMDPRVTLSHDPEDPELGILPDPGMQPLTWIERGVLMSLAEDRMFYMEALAENSPVRPPGISYRMSGGETSIENMIATTKRGVLVTRFSNVVGHNGSVAGVTRDGLWLIENGKITKPVKNFWFQASPIVVLNQVEQIGVPVPIFRPTRDPNSAGQQPPVWGGWSGWSVQPPLTPVIVPALKIRDFWFSSMADAT